MSVTARERSDIGRTPRTGRRFSRRAVALMLTGACGLAVGAGVTANAVLGGNGDRHSCGDELDISEGSAYGAINYGKNEGQIMAGRLGSTVNIGLAVGKSVGMFELHRFGDLDVSKGTTLTDGPVTVRFTAGEVDHGVVETVEISCAAAPTPH